MLLDPLCKIMPNLHVPYIFVNGNWATRTNLVNLFLLSGQFVPPLS